MSKLIYLTIWSFLFIAHSSFSQVGYDYKGRYEEAKGRSNWTKTTYSPELTGQWSQSGTLRLTINQGKVIWDMSEANKRQYDPPGIGEFEVVEYYRRNEYFMIVMKRPEKYLNSPVNQCYYSMFIRNLSSQRASFALSQRFCTDRKGQEEYWHGMSVHLEWRDSDINERFFYTYEKGSGSNPNVAKVNPGQASNKSTRPAAKNLRWVQFRGSIPSTAVVGGSENGRYLQVCRTNYNGAMHPGKVVANMCNIGWGGKEIVSRNYEILINDSGASLSWIPVRGQIPGNAVRAGVEGRTPLYVGQATMYNGSVHPGKIFRAGNGQYICNYGYGGNEIVERSNFKVLVKN